jgi:hypothetical protein
MLEIIKSPVTLRVLLYTVLPLLSVIPGVAVDPVTDVITIDPHQVWPYLVAGFASAFGVFAVWGKK